MKVPNEIYLAKTDESNIVLGDWSGATRTEVRGMLIKDNIKYVREDLVNDKIAHFEDHAYFAGQENMREDMKKWAQGRLKHYQKLLKDHPAEREYMALVGAYQDMIDKLEKI